MARQVFAVVVAALALLAATAGLGSAADAPSPSSGSGSSAESVFSYSGVPVSGPVSADHDVVGNIDGSDKDSGAPAAAGPGVSDVVPGPIGGPVPEGTFGPIGSEGPSASAAAAATAVPAVAGAVVAAVAASFFF